MMELVPKQQLGLNSFLWARHGHCSLEWLSAEIALRAPAQEGKGVYEGLPFPQSQLTLVRAAGVTKPYPSGSVDHYQLLGESFSSMV